MGGNLETVNRAAFDSLIGWWAESGVDVAVSETPRAWLRADAPTLSTSDEILPQLTARTERPKQFDAFREWLSTSPDLPMARTGAARVAPKGREASPLMLISDRPDRDDAVAGQPIGGDAWALTERMLAAIGIAPDAAYIASLACFHAPAARIDRDELERCAEIARDHIRLARPERLILFGDATSRALTGEPLARARGRVHRIEGIRTVATFHPRWLLQRPSDKSLAWRDLLLLMSDKD
nr:uracil-DNA glycosylase [uncultured Sphingomonas sp.]